MRSVEFKGLHKVEILEISFVPHNNETLRLNLTFLVLNICGKSPNGRIVEHPCATKRQWLSIFFNPLSTRKRQLLQIRKVGVTADDIRDQANLHRLCGEQLILEGYEVRSSSEYPQGWRVPTDECDKVMIPDDRAREALWKSLADLEKEMGKGNQPEPISQLAKKAKKKITRKGSKVATSSRKTKKRITL